MVLDEESLEVSFNYLDLFRSRDAECRPKHNVVTTVPNSDLDKEPVTNS